MPRLVNLPGGLKAAVHFEPLASSHHSLVGHQWPTIDAAEDLDLADGSGLRGHTKGVASQKNTRHLRTANGCQEKEEVVRKIEVSNWSEPECEGRVLASRI